MNSRTKIHHILAWIPDRVTQKGDVLDPPLGGRVCMPVKPGMDVGRKECVQVTRKPLMIRPHRRRQILNINQGARGHVMRDDNTVLVGQGLFQKRQTFTM